VESIEAGLRKFVEASLARLPGLLDIERYAEEITGPDETMDVVVNLSNRVNITFTPPTAP
jgi:hypothetical protein